MRLTKQFWWGVLVGVLLGAVVLADQSDFGNGVREMVSHGRSAVGALLTAAGEGSKGFAEGVGE